MPAKPEGEGREAEEEEASQRPIDDKPKGGRLLLQLRRGYELTHTYLNTTFSRFRLFSLVRTTRTKGRLVPSVTCAQVDSCAHRRYQHCPYHRALLSTTVMMYEAKSHNTQQMRGGRQNRDFNSLLL